MAKVLIILKLLFRYSRYQISAERFGMPLKSADLFTVHVGNLNSNVTEEELKILFTGTGDIRDVFIQTSFRDCRFTYGFVRYATLDEARTACLQIHGTILHGTAISVTFADSTNRKLDGVNTRYTNKEKSISKTPFPRKEGANYVSSHKDETEIHNALKQSLSNIGKKSELTEWMGMKSESDVQNFMKDFKDVLVSMSRVPQSIGVDAKSFEKKPAMSDLQDLIVNFHECSETSTNEFLPFKVVDFDVSSNR